MAGTNSDHLQRAGTLRKLLKEDGWHKLRSSAEGRHTLKSTEGRWHKLTSHDLHREAATFKISRRMQPLSASPAECRHTQDILQNAGTLRISCRMQAHSRSPAECRHTQERLQNAGTLKISCRMQTHLTLFYTRGLGVVVSHVMVPLPYRFAL